MNEGKLKSMKKSLDKRGHLITISLYKKSSEIFFDLFINNDKVKSLLYKAYISDPKNSDKYRTELYNDLENVCKSIVKKYNFRQVHFHTNENISFLRMHRPEKYGDDLTNIRESVRLANQNKTFVQGFEEGRIFNGYRFVYPLKYENSDIGTVEVSISLQTVIERIWYLYGVHADFIIKKSIVENKVFADEQTNYLPSPLSNNFLYDKNVLDAELSLKKNNNSDPMKNLNQQLIKKIEKKLMLGEKFLIEASDDKSPYIIIFLPIYNLKNEFVGYFVIYDQTPTLKILRKNKILSIVMFIVVESIVLFFILNIIFTQKKLKNIALHDPLTGLFNRNKFAEFLTREFELARRHHKKLSIILFDIDFFKKINDTFGHDIGDAVILKIAQITLETIRSTDLAIRWGGEEFLILLSETELKGAVTVAEKLRTKIEDTVFFDNQKSKITCSFGVTEIKYKNNIDHYIKFADAALYEAKESGRNRVCIKKDI